MAERSSVAEASPVSGDELKRAEEFAREPFVLEGEDPATALAEDGARRVALNAALKEIEDGPQRALRRVAARLLADPRPRAAARRGRAASRRRHHALRPPGRCPLRHADRARVRAPDRPSRERQRQVRLRGAALRRGRDRGRRAARRGAARLGPGRGGRGGGRRRRPGGGSRRGPPLLVRARHRRRQDGRGARLRGGLAHRRHPDPHPPAQPRGPVPRRAARPRLQEAHLGRRC